MTRVPSLVKSKFACNAKDAGFFVFFYKTKRHYRHKLNANRLLSLFRVPLHAKAFIISIRIMNE